MAGEENDTMLILDSLRTPSEHVENRAVTVPRAWDSRIHYDNLTITDVCYKSRAERNKTKDYSITWKEGAIITSRVLCMLIIARSRPIKEIGSWIGR